MDVLTNRWLHRRGTLAREGWESVVDAATPGSAHAGIRVAELTAGDAVLLAETGVERIVVPLAGSFEVVHEERDASTTTRLRGRSSVFDGPTDVLYLSAAATATLSGVGRVAVATSPTTELHPTTHVPASSVPVELRGRGASSRQVHDFGTPATLAAARLIACEVITPAGNWSSYPPHKHDEDVPGEESRLEEIYYFEMAPTRAGGSGAGTDGAFGMFSTYSSPSGDIEIDARVRFGDIALVPYGYHGPAVAAPGYDMYYLNVMAGSRRAWQITDDPAHAWIRSTWEGQDLDARLPYDEGKSR